MFVCDDVMVTGCMIIQAGPLFLIFIYMGQGISLLKPRHRMRMSVSSVTTACAA